VATKKAEEFVADVGGVEIRLPLLSELKTGVVRKIRNLDAGDQVFTIIEMLCTDDELAAVDEMTQPELAKLMEDWQEASGISVGESSASSR